MNPAAWLETSLPPYPKLDRDLDVDLVVVGGGITGITAAYLAKRAGLTVALLERDRFVTGETSRTTAHVTAVTDMRLFEVEEAFGLDAARAVWDAGNAAIDEIVTAIRTEAIACDFRWVPGFLHAKLANGTAAKLQGLRREEALARRLGISARWEEAIPLFGLPGIRFEHQASLHPRKYLKVLVSRVPGQGGHVFENTEARIKEGGEPAVEANGFTVRGRMVFLATHIPVTGTAPLLKSFVAQTKLAPYSSYVVGARLPRGSLPEGLFWDMDEPYHYTRVDSYPEFDYVIFGGEDHKTGQHDATAEPYDRLKRLLLRHLPKADIDYQWSGQVIESADGLPHIGEIAPGWYVGTGYAGNGTTFGTIAARMGVDHLLGRRNPWKGLFAADRTALRGGTWTYLKENLDYPFHLVRDRIAANEGHSVEQVPRGEGRILGLEGRKVAAFRDGDGRVTLLSPVCTHLKCIVNWNEAEKSWDCPCHGARFHPTGEVISGPASEPLERLGQDADRMRPPINGE